MTYTKMQTDYGSSSISQSIAAELLASGTYAEHNKKLRANVKQRRNTALAALNKYFKNIATWNCPSGGYFIWVKLNKGVSMQALFLKALKYKVLIHPGDLYEFHSNQTIRISYSYASLEDIYLGIKRLSKIIEDLLIKKDF
jgi:GntR family transcriptional regulator of abcA and norABC